MEQLGITVFDVAVIAIGVFGAAIGASAGFAHAILFIGSWLGAGYVALNYSSMIQPEIAKLVNGNNELATFGSMLVVFVAALIVLVMLTNTLSRSIKASPLKRPDAILGAGFGVLCAWVGLGTAFLFYSYLGPKQLPPPVEAGATFPAIKDMANFVEPYLPPGFRTRLQRSGGVDALPAIPPMPTMPSGTPDPSLPANPASPGTKQ
jgi:membrane protein required for colicin V production